VKLFDISVEQMRLHMGLIRARHADRWALPLSMLWLNGAS